MQREIVAVRNASLDEHWFADLADSRHEIERWRLGYNGPRFHRSLVGRTAPGAVVELAELGIFR